MRQKYHTEALVLHSSEFKESNKLYYIFSQKFGLILASAQGVRFLKSKMRYTLQEFSLCDISIVRTGDMWKITNCSSKVNYYFELKDNKKKLDVVLRVSEFLKRFLHGEEEDELLYSYIKSGFDLIMADSEHEESDIEGAIKINLLYRLGILKGENLVKNIWQSPTFAEAVKNYKIQKKEAEVVLSASLSESQL
jgi:DNA repair protein RecO